MSGGGSKPGERRGGRKKGTPNKVSRDLRTMILNALDQAGGEAYLREQSRANPGPFMTLVGKVLPTKVVGDANEAPLTVSVEQKKAEAVAAIKAAFAEVEIAEPEKPVDGPHDGSFAAAAVISATIQ